MAKMTKQDAAMLKILQDRYGAGVYKSPPKSTTPDMARSKNAAKLARKAKKK
jgi:hypothetical protein